MSGSREFHIAGDLNAEHVGGLHDHIIDAVDDWLEARGIAADARMMVAALLCNACGIIRDAPDDETRARMAEKAVHLIMHNSGADARMVFDEHRRRVREAGSLLAVEPEGSA